MTDADRANIVQKLCGRHDELLAALELLEQEIAGVLAAARPISPTPEPAASSVAAGAKRLRT